MSLKIVLFLFSTPQNIWRYYFTLLQKRAILILGWYFTVLLIRKIVSSIRISMIRLVPHPFRNLFAWNFSPLEIDISDNTRFQKNLLPSNDSPSPPRKSYL